MRRMWVSEEGAVDAAVEVLRSGGVVVFPTDTLYGLLASVESKEALERVANIKGRDESKPFPVFVAGMGVAERYAVFTPLARRLWSRFMPGALTLVLGAKREIPYVSPRGTVGLRMPNHPALLKVLSFLGVGVVGTSANFSGEPPAASHLELSEKLCSLVDLVVLEEGTLGGVASTVVDARGDVPVVLRRGALDEEEIRGVLRG